MIERTANDRGPRSGAVSPPPADRNSVARRLALLAALSAALLVGTVTVETRRWIGATFPGFFVLANRVVPSIALPEWTVDAHAQLFQREIIAVDGAPVSTQAAVYERVRALPPGTSITYTVRATDGGTSALEVPSRRFSAADYFFLFGAYLLNGTVFMLIGLLAFWLRPRSADSAGLLSLGLTTGLFVVTAADIYGAHWFFRIHVVAESFLAPSFLHLALVFPVDRIASRRRAILCAVYFPFAVLAVAYEFALGSPPAYTALHLAATATHAIGAAALIAAVLHGLVRGGSPLVRRTVAIVAMGATAAFFAPIVFWAASALLGGQVALNSAALTAFLFPLTLGYAVVQRSVRPETEIAAR